MSLYRAETRRLTKRRFVRLTMLGLLLVLGAIGVATFFTNQQVGPSQIAAAQAAADRDYQQQAQIAQQEQARCEAAQGTADAANFPPNCAEGYAVSRENFDPQWYLPGTFEFRKDFRDMVIVAGSLIALAAFVVGASFVGAEWASGGMMNLLLWRPQRLRVLLTKLGALVVNLTGFTVLALAAWTAVCLLIARFRGTTDNLTSGVWQSYGLMGLRALLLVVVAGAVGFGLASLGRHTAMALGVAGAVLVLFQIGLYTVLDLANVAFAEAWLIPTWLAAWFNKRVELENYDSCNFSVNGGCETDKLVLTYPMAGGLMAVVVVLVVVAAMWTIRSRDIT